MPLGSPYDSFPAGQLFDTMTPLGRRAARQPDCGVDIADGHLESLDQPLVETLETNPGDLCSTGAARNSDGIPSRCDRDIERLLDARQVPVEIAIQKRN